MYVGDPLRFVLTTIFLSISGLVNAASCVMTDDMVNAWNKKFEQSVAISTKDTGTEVLVQITAPLQIEGKKLTDIFLVKGSLRAPDLVIPIGWKIESNLVTSGFSLTPVQAKESTIILNFGECGIELRYPVHVQ